MTDTDDLLRDADTIGKADLYNKRITSFAKRAAARIRELEADYNALDERFDFWVSAASDENTLRNAAEAKVAALTETLRSIHTDHIVGGNHRNNADKLAAFWGVIDDALAATEKADD